MDDKIFDQIQQVDLKKTMESSYIDYAMSVIASRALPDVCLLYTSIDRLVDSIFANYLSRPGVRQPIFTSYCDGNRVSCQGLSQWGSKYLGDQGYSAIEIIRYYYGNDMYINAAQAISGVPSSWPCLLYTSIQDSQLFHTFPHLFLPVCQVDLLCAQL